MNAVTIDSTYVYFYGWKQVYDWDAMTVTYTMILEKRNRSDGSIEWREIDTLHAIVVDYFSDPGDFICNITSDSDHLYTTCSYFQMGRYGMMYQRRNKTDATLDWNQSFTFTPGATYWGTTGVIVDDTYIYALLNGDTNGNFRCFKILKSNGSVISTINPLADNPGLLQDIAQDDSYIYISSMKRIAKYLKSDFSKQWSVAFGTGPGYTQSGGCVDVDSTGVYIGMSVWYYSAQIKRGKIQKRSLSDGSLVYEQEIQQPVEETNDQINYLSIKVGSDSFVVSGSRRKYYDDPYFSLYLWGSIEVFQKSDGARTEYHASFQTSPPVDGRDVRLCSLQIDGDERYSGGPRDAWPEDYFGMVKLQKGTTDPVPFFDHTPM